ncbi:hypothetical protein N7537_008819 [Penicillium hordei]|uniref:Uncharacterized protein n=1 Tax=Penicillium hordei TaxID=40994 RepID=A0AAD6E1J1_9EURO|nr:uncharacterized protein N7537_008819 [Penicillium hordei]KAJ5598735.1 hypothetical protein N7537_008819 [Penicillium hordei]
MTSMPEYGVFDDVTPKKSFRGPIPRIMLSFLDLLYLLNPKLKKSLSHPYCQEAFFCVSSQRHSPSYSKLGLELHNPTRSSH